MLFEWIRNRINPPTPVAAPVDRPNAPSTHRTDQMPSKAISAAATKAWLNLQDMIAASVPVPARTADFAMDEQEYDSQGGQFLKSGFATAQPNISEVLLLWYASQSFIGHQMAAILAQHWLVLKACAMPARDAIRNGYKITTEDGGKLDVRIINAVKKCDKHYKVNSALREFLTKGRIFGVRVAFFKVNSPDPLYYEKPFNPDGILPNSYKGIVQVDPYWCTPILDSEAAADPTSLEFYEPTYWLIKGERYHRSHLVIFRNGELADVLKPSYLYGGIPVPQMIMERIYNAERTANEGPLLAMTKRTTVFATNLEEAFANKDKFDTNLAIWAHYRDNFQVKVIDKTEDEISFSDTSLADLDEVIMDQYQLVAAGAGVPSTKLLGTQPRGFNSNGDYETESYHEELETIQTHDLQPLVERHHVYCMRSDVAWRLGIRPINLTIQWNKLDVPTALELAQTNLAKAQADVALVTAGAIDGIDSRNRLINDEESGYTGIPEALRPDETDDDDDDEENPQNPADPKEAGMGGPVQRQSNQGKPAASSGNSGKPASRQAAQAH